MKIILDSNVYEVDSPVRRETLQEWPEQFRTTGQGKRADRVLINSHSYDSWAQGLGVRRLVKESDNGFFWDSDCETRFPGQITPPIQAIVDSITPAANLGHLTLWQGKMLAIAMGTVGTTVPIYEYAVGSGWVIGTYHPAVTTPTTGMNWRAIGLDAGNEVGLVSVVEEFQPDAGVWFTAFTKGTAKRVGGNLFPLPNLRCNETAIKLVNTLQTEQLVVWGRKSDTQQGMWGIVATLAMIGTQIAESRQLGDGEEFVINSVLSFPNVYGSMYPSGLFPQNMRTLGTGSVQQEFLRFDTRHQDNGRGAMEWQRNLIIPLANGGIYGYRPDGVVEDVGPVIDDGLPNDLQGPYSTLEGSYRWLFAAKGGVPSGDYARILAFDKTAWHSVYKHKTVNQIITSMKISNLDNVSRLHFLAAGTYGLGATLAYHLPYILDNPANTPSLGVATQGYVEFPEFNGFMPEVPGGWYRNLIQGVGLSAQNTITSLYGFDGRAANVTLGVATQNFTTLSFGQQGTTARYISNRFLLTRGTLSGTYPQFFLSSLDYYKKPPVREIWQMLIDLEQTAKIHQRSTELVLTEIGSLANNLSLVGLQYGQMPTKWVRVETQQPDELTGMDWKLTEPRVGKVALRLVEM